MAWDTIGNVETNAASIKAALEAWETDVSPASIEDWEIVKTGSNRATIVLEYSTA